MFVIDGIYTDLHTLAGVSFGLYGQTNDVIIVKTQEGMEILLDPGEARELQQQLTSALQYYEGV